MTHDIATMVFSAFGLVSLVLFVVSYRQTKKAQELGLRTSRLTWSRIDTTNSSPEFQRNVLRTNVLIAVIMIAFAKVVVGFHIFG